jgi:DNA protecting protein DprA
MVSVRLVAAGQGGRALHVADDESRHALLLALAEVLAPHLNGPTSYRLAQALEGQRRGAAAALEDDGPWLGEGLSRVDDARVTFWRGELARLLEGGVAMIDPLDDAYPANLRMVHNRPPFLMVRGNLQPGDVRAMAVVGTRQSSPEGRAAAFRISSELAARDVTVVSGLATGIDTEAHDGALHGGGRTIAVFGTGIRVVYPSQNTELADRVSASGACVSQFWPAMRGARWTFPARNLVTSGLSIGTVVVEAGATSGARLQAEAALDHGKRVLLLRRLVESQPWAAETASRPGVSVVESVDEVIDAVDRELQIDTASVM